MTDRQAREESFSWQATDVALFSVFCNAVSVWMSSRISHLASRISHSCYLTFPCFLDSSTCARASKAYAHFTSMVFLVAIVHTRTSQGASAPTFLCFAYQNSSKRVTKWTLDFALEKRMISYLDEIGPSMPAGLTSLRVLPTSRAHVNM
jgi:hypothetical protein